MAKNRANDPNDRRRDRSAKAEPASPPPRRSPWKLIAVLVIGGAAIAGAVVIEMERSKPAASPAPYSPGYVPAPATPPGGGSIQSIPQPAGEVPPGKVWSKEHGHWHDAAAQTPQ